MPDETTDTSVLDTIAAMTLDSLERCGLDDHDTLLVRIAALAAVDAKPVSYLAHVDAAVDAGVTIEEVQNVLIAVAPIIGTPRVMSAAIGISEALGVAIAVVEAELDAEAN
jgi:alkylhydroperoxidase/carboxymuconolactone decarboxylase family protein YurZ